MKFFALIGMAATIKVDGDWWGGDKGIIDQVKSVPNAEGCDKRLWISDDEMRW